MIKSEENPSSRNGEHAELFFDSPVERARWVFAAHQCGSTLVEIAATLGVSSSRATQLNAKGRRITILEPSTWYNGLDLRVANRLCEAGFSSRDQVYQAVKNKEITDKPTTEERAKFMGAQQTAVPGLGVIGLRSLRQWLGIAEES
jgi:hypothetical protein